jgi:peroxiredoxin family protein
MDLLIDVHSGELDTLIPNLSMASMLKAQGIDVAVFLEWRALVAFVENDFRYSSPLAKYADAIEHGAQETRLPIDPPTLLRGVKAAAIPIYACGVEADLCGIRDKVPPEVQLLPMEELGRPIVEARKIIGGM